MLQVVDASADIDERLERRMRGDVLDPLAVDVDGAAVPNGGLVFFNRSVSCALLFNVLMPARLSPASTYRASRGLGKIGLSGSLLSGVRSIVSGSDMCRFSVKIAVAWRYARKSNRSSRRRAVDLSKQTADAVGIRLRSVGIRGVFGIQNALHLVEMGDREIVSCSQSCAVFSATSSGRTFNG